MKLERNLKRPKIDLHCHLDGGLRRETVLELLGERVDRDSLEKMEKRLSVSLECESLIDYLKCFDLPIEVMQTRENLERIAFEMMEDAALDNVKYIELRFAPQQHKKLGLNTKEIIEGVLAGIKKGEERYDIKGNLILSCMRHLSEESAIEIVESGAEFIGKGVVAFDLCGGEDLGFSKKFINVAKRAKELGYHITIHAGETGYSENVEEAITLLGAERIGHGLFIWKDKDVYSKVLKREVFLEMCPTSNLQTKGVSSYKEHPIYDYLKDGIKVTLNTDNPTVSNTKMSKEYSVIEENFNISEKELDQLYLNSIEGAFISQEEKDRLKSYLK